MGDWFFIFFFFFFKQKTAYEMRISDWSSDVCSSDLSSGGGGSAHRGFLVGGFVMSESNPQAGIDVVLAQPRGFCAGVDRAIDKIGRASCRERVCQYV